MSGVATDWERTREEFVQLWANGLTLREIAEHFGWTPGYAGQALHRFRRYGCDLPYRQGPRSDSVRQTMRGAARRRNA